MTDRNNVDAAASGLMLLICLIWAFQSIGLKLTAADASPVMQIGLRSGLAAVLIWIVVTVRGERIQWFGATAGLGALAGILFALNYFLVGESLNLTSASHAVVFLYTAPIFAGLGLHFGTPSERLGILQWAGILVAAAGIAYAFLASPAESQGPTKSTVSGDLVALLGGAVWGASTVLIRLTRLGSVAASHLLLYQLCSAFLILTVFALATGGGVTLTAGLALNMVFHTLGVSFLSFLVWFWLLTRYKASQLGVFSFVTPVMGVLLGHSVLDEPMTPEFVRGAALVLAGIAIVSVHPWLAAKIRKPTAGSSSAT